MKDEAADEPKRPVDGTRRIASRLLARWRWFLGAGVAAFVMVLLAGLPGLLLGSATARDAVLERLEALTGQPVSIDGSVDFALLPQTHLTLERIKIGDREGIDIDRVVADLDAIDALMGRAEISRLLLIRPEWRPPPLTGAPEAAVSDASPEGSSRTALTALNSLLDRLDGINTVEVRDGLFRPSDSANSGQRGLSNANLVIERNDGGAMRIEGGFIWNGQPTDLTLAVDAPAATQGDDRSTVSLDIVSPALSLNFAGQARLGHFRRLDGRFRMQSQSFARSVEWVAEPAVHVPDLGPMALTGDLTVRGRKLDLRQAELLLSGARGRGAIDASFETDRPVFGGTLAFDQFDITPIARSIAPFPSDLLDYERRLDMDFAKMVDLEFRVSASEARLGDVGFRDVAAVINVSDGVAQLDLGDVNAFGGRGRARLAIDAGTSPAHVDGEFDLSGIETALLFEALSIEAVGLSGRSALRAEWKAPAANWRSLLDGLDLTAHIETRNGTVSGFDPRVFARPGARPLIEGTSAGEIPFDSLEAMLALSGTRLKMRQIMIRNQAGLLEAAGTYDAADNRIDLTGAFSATQTDVASQTAESFTSPKRIGFTMQGEWPDPAVTTAEPDPM
ncbi:AsmA family protein [Jiella marina]|uniref:AsmA family protein n=1 Tax=Jiella sp. LLJ827 TaxID=2917712 RepID=UPI002100FEC3|nr:hypothetical protein [Jiella sp. LLJ827]